MRRRALTTALAVALMAVAIPAHAGDKKLITGMLLIAGGGGLTIGAFNYDTSCAPGETTVTVRVNGVNDTSCVRSTYNAVTVSEQTTTGTFARPALLWAGLGTAAAGVVVLMLPTKAQTVAGGVTANVTPGGWRVSKTVAWGGAR
jgi:hypothetical protein